MDLGSLLQHEARNTRDGMEEETPGRSYAWHMCLPLSKRKNHTDSSLGMQYRPTILRL